jgi:hypothetical protein
MFRPCTDRQRADISQTEVRMLVDYHQFANSQILQTGFQFYAVLSDECLFSCIFQESNISMKLVVYLRTMPHSFDTEYTYKRI